MLQRALSSSFIRLRWCAFFGQLLVLIAAVGFFDLTLPWEKILLLLAIIPVSNLAARTLFASKIREEQLVGGLLVLDTILLTAVLREAGGPTNPFTIVYLLHVVLAAVMLTPAWTWSIAALSCTGFFSLFVSSRAVPEWEHHGAHHGFSLHLHGMLAAYITVAFLVAYFLSKIVGELRRKEHRLSRLEHIAANQQRLTTLTTMTAGAAHELGTPLGTIAIVSHELEKALERKYPDKLLLEDVALLKSEISRCKKVLEELAKQSGDLLGEYLESLSASQLIAEAIVPLAAENRVNVSGSTDLLLHRVPRNALTIALRALLKNALEASENSPIEVEVTQRNQEVQFQIRDRGMGISSENLERIGEPFFSTKGAGKGMGLGVYLTKLTAEQLGGTLSFASKLGEGTQALFSFPLSAHNEEKAA